MPKVYNKLLGGFPAQAVYVGRPTKFGNPYSHTDTKFNTTKVETREEAIQRFREYIAARPDLIAAARRELRGKDLVCWCAPLACHADVLLEIANSEEPA